MCSNSALTNFLVIKFVKLESSLISNPPLDHFIDHSTNDIISSSIVYLKLLRTKIFVDFMVFEEPIKLYPQKLAIYIYNYVYI